MKLISSFPREFAFPQRVLCNTEKEFYRYFNLYNGIKNKLYFSLYNTNKDIDLIAFDLDNENSLTNAKKLHFYCKEKNLKHLITFSTRGLWVYIFNKNYTNLKNKKDALKNAQLYILKQADIEVKEVDSCTLGDIMRISRLPGSLDAKRRLYCTPLSEEDLILGYEHIRNKAKSQQLHFKYYGNELLDIKQFDRECECIIDIPVLNYDSKILIEKDAVLKLLPQCLALALVRGDTHWKERYHIIMYLKEKGLMINEIVDIFKQFMHNEKFRQDIVKERHVQLVFQRQNLLAANKGTLMKEGICGSWCNHENIKIYK